MPEAGTITVPVEVTVSFNVDGTSVPLEKAKLSTKERDNLDADDFVFPKERAYPIHDENHARAALSEGAQHESGSRLAKIRAAVKAKFPGIKVGKAEEIEVPLWKDDAKQIVYGVVLTPGVRDSQGDVIDAPEIERAAHRFLTAYRKHDVQHNEVAGAAETVESYIAPVDMEIAGNQILKGSWLLGMHITDDSTWQEVVKGERTGLSIGGAGVRHPD